MVGCHAPGITAGHVHSVPQPSPHLQFVFNHFLKNTHMRVRNELNRVSSPILGREGSWWASPEIQKRQADTSPRMYGGGVAAAHKPFPAGTEARGTEGLRAPDGHSDTKTEPGCPGHLLSGPCLVVLAVPLSLQAARGLGLHQPREPPASARNPPTAVPRGPWVKPWAASRPLGANLHEGGQPDESASSRPPTGRQVHSDSPNSGPFKYVCVP